MQQHVDVASMPGWLRHSVRTLLGERKEQLHGRLRVAHCPRRLRQRMLSHLADEQQVWRRCVQNQRPQEGERI